MTGKEKCAELKEIRRKMANKLGIDLHQRECTYEGECTGTCPKCKAEELQLNKELFKRKAAVVGATAFTALSLTACTNPIDIGNNGGDSDFELEGMPTTCYDEFDSYGDDNELTGDVPAPADEENDPSDCDASGCDVSDCDVSDCDCEDDECGEDKNSTKGVSDEEEDSRDIMDEIVGVAPFDN